MEHVRALEGKDSVARGWQVQAALQALGIKATVQERRHPQIKNIIVDFSANSEEKRLLFSAHYDAVKGSPAANDNASSVAVLLGLCRELRDVRAAVRVIFFDREEAWVRTPFLRLGLLGSLYYVLKNDLSNIAFVYNLEYCGLGDFLGVWPVKNNERNLPVIKTLEKAAAKMELGLLCTHLPWLLLSSDHLPFRLKGLHNSVTLSLLPASQIPVFERMISSLSVLKLLTGRRPAMPEVLSSVHTVNDVSSRLSEKSLGLMLSLLLAITRLHRSSGNQGR
ncbi:MAG: M28 family peptidase [Chloroflexi bacterium]|nr:M28 family peptidase [Chloroflexota bacterium]